MTHKPHRIIVLSILAALALAVPSASARPIDEVGPATQPAQSAQPAENGGEYRSPNSITGSTAPSASQVTVERVSSESGFDWGDAGIGAGAMLALSLVAVGGGLLVVGYRKGHPRPAATG